jgi:hypothetical protein
MCALHYGIHTYRANMATPEDLKRAESCFGCTSVLVLIAWSAFGLAMLSCSTVNTLFSGTEPLTLSSGMMCLILPFLVAAVLATLYNENVRNRARRFRQNGRTITGSVIRTATTRDDDGVTMIRVQYEFRSPRSGKRIVAWSRRHRLQGYQPIARTPVHIYYADDRTYALL